MVPLDNLEASAQAIRQVRNKPIDFPRQFLELFYAIFNVTSKLFVFGRRNVKS